MTASRLVALTLGELRRTSETSDLDTPARAATVSRVGFRAVRPGVAMHPSFCQRWSAPTLRVRRDRVNDPDAMKPGFQCVRTPWIRGFMAFAGRAGRRGRSVGAAGPVAEHGAGVF